MTPKIGKEYYVKTVLKEKFKEGSVRIETSFSDGTHYAHFIPESDLIEIQDGTWQEGYKAAKEFYEEVLGASKDKLKVQKYDYMSVNTGTPMRIAEALAVGYELDFIAGEFVYLKRPINE